MDFYGRVKPAVLTFVEIYYRKGISMILLNREDIQSVFSMSDAIKSDKRCYMMNSKGAFAVPKRPVISCEYGDFCFMPSYCEELSAAACKVVNIMPGNADLKLPVSIGQLMVFDGRTGEAVAFLDGTYVTALRTAAASGTAFELFGIQNAKTGALIGTGSIAMCQLEAMMTVRKLQEIRVYDLDLARARTFAEKAKGLSEKFGTDVVVCDVADEAVCEADLVTLATTSHVPVCSSESFKEGCVISAAGSFRHDMQELDPGVFKKKVKIYFDSAEAVLSESGDILRPLEEGILSEDLFIGEIGDALLGRIPLRESEDEIIVFENVGFGALDLTAGVEIAKKAEEHGVGTVWKQEEQE